MRVDPHKYGESILLAVSGGVDSMVMASLFLREHRKGNVPLRRLAVANCNFSLRGEESDGDSALVQKWCEANGVEFFGKVFDTTSFASKGGISIEMAARQLRYVWFDSLCAKEGFDGVCVAHNANDNAETLMLNLLRGTGIKGLCAMEEFSRNPYGSTWVFRPLLGFSRAEIEAWAREHSLSWRNDSTNFLSECRRNILRNEVFPLLEKINPSFVSTLGADIANFRQAAAIVEDYLADARHRLGLPADVRTFATSADVPLSAAARPYIVSSRGVAVSSAAALSRLEIRYDALRGEPHAAALLFDILSSFGFNRAVITDITTLVLAEELPNPGRMFFSRDYCLAFSSESLILEARTFFDEVQLPVVEELEWKEGMSAHTSAGCLIIDADALGHYPVFRKWKEGDYLRPFGMRGKKKISDLLVDLKYDVLKKKRALVLEGEGNHVLALVGERIDDSLKVGPSTRRIYRITLNENV